MPTVGGYQCFKGTHYVHRQNQSDWVKKIVRLYRHVAMKAVNVV
jgi:hypothetical protein